MSVISPAVHAPVYAPNALVADLRTAEMYVVCAVRLWLANHRGVAGAARDLERGFDMAGVADEGMSGLCRFFDAVAVTASRSLDIRCVRCAHLGADEAVMLQAVSLLQQGFRHSVAMLFADWLPAAALRVALPALADFAAVLAGAGLIVPRRHGAAMGTGVSATMGCSDRGVALVH